MRKHALVVGGSIDFRLATRSRLVSDGFQVTVVRTVGQGLKQLASHRFSVCVVDFSGISRARDVRRMYRSLTERSDAALEVHAGRPAARRERPSRHAT
jgi:NAD(P)-dependent dehydrogenase (short-subunit alcohol dehydrogenase family)